MFKKTNLPSPSQKLHNSVEKPQNIQDTAVLKPNNKPQEVFNLSISGIKRRQQTLQTQEITQATNQQQKAFSQSDLNSVWQKFILELRQKQRKNLAFGLEITNKKIVDNHIISLEVPNQTFKFELKEIQEEFVLFLKTNLQNHSIKLEVEIDSTIGKDKIFSKEEKLQYLKESNPNIALFIEAFKLK